MGEVRADKVWQGEYAVPNWAFSEKELNCMGPFRGADVIEMATHLLASKQVTVNELITVVLPFGRAADAWEKTRKEQGIQALICGPQKSWLRRLCFCSSTWH
jgi:D-xylulose reductase